MAAKRKQEEGQEFAHKWQHPDSQYMKFTQETDQQKALAMYVRHKEKRRRQKEEMEKLQGQQKQGEVTQQEQGAAAGSAGGDKQQAPERGAVAGSALGDKQLALEQGATASTGEGAEGEEKQPESDFEDSWPSTPPIAWPEALSPDWCGVFEESQAPSP